METDVFVFPPLRTMDVLISLNHGKSFISTAYTITASTCVSLMIYIFMSSVQLLHPDQKSHFLLWLEV